MSTDPRNEIFDLKLKAWESITLENPDAEGLFHDPITSAMRLSRDYDPPQGTLRITDAGEDDPDDLRVYERTSVPVYDGTFSKPQPEDTDYLMLLHVWEQQQRAVARFERRYPGLSLDDDGSRAQRDPRQAPNADGNLLWSFMFSNKEPRDVPTGIDGPNPWLTIEPLPDGAIEHPITIYDPTDSLRFKAMKCITVAVYQARAAWRIGGTVGDDGGIQAPYFLERPFAGMDIFRAFSTFPNPTPGMHIVNIEERAYLELEDRLHIEELLSESVANQFFEILISGWVPRTVPGQSDNPSANTDRVYPFLEAVRGRLGACALDESHRRRVFRLAEQNNTVLRITPGGGTVNVHEESIAGFFLRLTMFLVEDLADSTYGE